MRPRKRGRGWPHSGQDCRPVLRIGGGQSSGGNADAGAPQGSPARPSRLTATADCLGIGGGLPAVAPPTSVARPSADMPGDVPEHRRGGRKLLFADRQEAVPPLRLTNPGDERVGGVQSPPVARLGLGEADAHGGGVTVLPCADCRRIAPVILVCRRGRVFQRLRTGRGGWRG